MHNTQLCDWLYLYTPLEYTLKNPDKCKVKILYYSLEVSKEKKIQQMMCYLLFKMSNYNAHIDIKSLNSVFEGRPVDDRILELLETEEYKNRIVKADYLSLDLEYKKGRCVIGNPPFGVKNNLTVTFYKKSVQIADYISFILPISQYNNHIKLYEYDLLYTENLGAMQYSDRIVHCCLNIYKKKKRG